MMILVWLLWALKLSGLSAMEYTTLWLITVVVVVIATILRVVNESLMEKRLVREVDACGDVGDEEVIPTLLTLILRRLYVK